MAYLGESYSNDEAERKEDGGASSLPPSEQNPSKSYYGRIVKAETESVKNNGIQLVLEFDVLHPEKFEGRKAWDRITIKTDNEKAKAYIEGNMNDLRKACKLPVLEDTDQLVDKIVQFESIVKLGGEKYIDKQGNEKITTEQTKITKYWPEDFDVATYKLSKPARTPEEKAQPNPRTFGEASTATAPAASATASAAKKMPWKK